MLVQNGNQVTRMRVMSADFVRFVFQFGLISSLTLAVARICTLHD